MSRDSKGITASFGGRLLLVVAGGFLGLIVGNFLGVLFFSGTSHLTAMELAGSVTAGVATGLLSALLPGRGAVLAAAGPIIGILLNWFGLGHNVRSSEIVFKSGQPVDFSAVKVHPDYSTLLLTLVAAFAASMVVWFLLDKIRRRAGQDSSAK